MEVFFGLELARRFLSYQEPLIRKWRAPHEVPIIIPCTKSESLRLWYIEASCDLRCSHALRFTRKKDLRMRLYFKCKGSLYQWNSSACARHLDVGARIIHVSMDLENLYLRNLVRTILFNGQFLLDACFFFFFVSFLLWIFVNYEWRFKLEILLHFDSRIDILLAAKRY